ncbi:putative Sin3 binding protein-domain-containing protein [Rhexocercosporidium sp. MPI-PUGE-AT-0058]|nr:putative Sin3 binding protein-domain-containing protein [Rhexocercosporidium sp. MPI-PUGE-AT-0058]
MASMASSARDIPKNLGRDSLTAVAARSVPATKNHPLPTPPNSISPSLPPHGIKPYGTRSASLQVPEHVDSDIDLQDGQGSEQDTVAGRGRDLGSPGFDAAGNITPSLLAKHHLPEILLNHGPLAIRHIMGFLTTAVPGFSGIPPAKARRLVVGALEGRGSGGEGAGMKGNVKFEKVGWGRWDARLKGHPARSSRGGNQHSPPPSAPSSYSNGMPIAKNGGRGADRTRLNAPDSSWAGDSAVFSHDEDTTMLENEADKMSLDGDESCSSSEAPPEDDVMGDSDDMMTDEEDWAAVGAAALRAASYSASGSGRNFLSSRIYTGGSGGGPSLSTMAKSVPARTLQPLPNNIDFAAFGMASDSQEREAVEALLRLGSV